LKRLVLDKPMFLHKVWACHSGFN